jgi:hypothetical protein
MLRCPTILCFEGCVVSCLKGHVDSLLVPENSALSDEIFGNSKCLIQAVPQGTDIDIDIYLSFHKILTWLSTSGYRVSQHEHTEKYHYCTDKKKTVKNGVF